MDPNSVHDLEKAPYAQLIVRDEDVPDEVRQACRQPPKTGCAAACWEACMCQWTEHRCLTHAFDAVIRHKMVQAGMYVGGNFSRDGFAGTPQVPAGRDVKAGVVTEDLEIPCELLEPEPGKKGIETRVFWPIQHRAGAKLPVVVAIHGGGFCVGTAKARTYDKIYKRLMKVMGGEIGGEIVVVAPDYRLAPEFPFPQPVYDTYDTFRWLASAAAREHFAGHEIELDLSRVIVMGDSAGANLALCVSTLLRDGIQADLTPAPAEMAALRVIEVTPIVPTLGLGKLTVSAHTMTKSPILSDFSADWFLRSYLGETEAEREKAYADRRLNPLQSTGGLRGLNHVTVLSGGKDPLRDDARILELALAEVGVPCAHHHYDRGVHGWLVFPWEPSKDAINFIADGWRAALDLVAPKDQEVAETAALEDEPQGQTD